MSGLTLAADIGGTNIRAAIIDDAGFVHEEKCVSAHLSDKNITEQDVIQTLTDFFNVFLKNDPKITAVAIGFPGFFIGNSGVLASSPNLPNLKNFKLAKMLSDSINLPVTAQNDALCAAMGELHFGAAKGQKNLLHITLGTGVGGGLILNHTPYTGEGGMAMEFGHLRVCHDDSAHLCGCGGHGCIEAYASASAVASHYFKLSGIQLNSKEVYEKAMQGEYHAMNVLEDAGHKLGMAIAEAVTLLDIHTVTISGGLIGAWSFLHPAIMSSLNSQLILPMQNKIQVLPSTLNDQAGLLGAAALTRL
ncbi:MAG: ROK family protein [Mariprofundaceae bacterium]|nr:ROK family protein [Mariprofundaceae bacterium]